MSCGCADVCNCFLSDTDTVSITGNGTSGSPYQATVIPGCGLENTPLGVAVDIDPASPIPISCSVDGLSVGPAPVCVVDSDTIDFSVDEDGCVSGDVILDPSPTNILSASAAGLLAECCDVESLPPNGAICEFLGNAAPGVPAWVQPRTAPLSLYQDVAPGDIALNWTVNADDVFHSVGPTPFTAFANTENCVQIVMFQARILITAFEQADAVQKRFQHNAGIAANRSIAQPVAIGSNTVAFAANAGSMGHIISCGAGGDPAAVDGTFDDVTLFARVFPGDVVTYAFFGTAKNTQSMEPTSFHAEITNYSYQSWRVGIS